MRTGNDMYVDYDELCVMETKLAAIRQALYESNSVMSQELIASQNFLEGQQFEKAKAATFRCIQLSGRICDNIRNSLEYIEKLKECLDDYTRSGYPEGMK